MPPRTVEHFDVVVVGAGECFLACARLTHIVWQRRAATGLGGNQPLRLPLLDFSCHLSILP